MYRGLAWCVGVVLLSAVTAWAQDVRTDKRSEADQQSDAKELSGMSIVGNEEAPKALYIVPWKSSEIGGETNMNTMLNEGDVPVDRDVFKRQVEYYEVSTKK